MESPGFDPAQRSNHDKTPGRKERLPLLPYLKRSEDDRSPAPNIDIQTVELGHSSAIGHGQGDNHQQILKKHVPNTQGGVGTARGGVQ